MQSQEDSPPIISFDVSSEVKNLGERVEFGFINPKLLHKADTNCRKVDISDNEKVIMDATTSNYGIIDPVVINMDNGVVKGQLRWSSALRVNLDRIPFIRMKFKDVFSERSASALDDTTKHPWSKEDWRYYIGVNLNEGKTYEQIANAVCLSVDHIRAKMRGAYIHPSMYGNDEAIKKYEELQPDKQNAVKGILDTKQYEDASPEKVTKLVDYAIVAPVRDVQDLRKTSKKYSDIDVDSRLKKVKKKTSILRIKVDKELMDKFTAYCNRRHRDPINVVEELIRAYIGKSNIYQIVEI